MKRAQIIFVVGLMFILSSFRVLWAGEIKIAVVDFQKVFDQSAVIKELNFELEQKVKAEEEVISKKRDSLQERKADLDKQQSMLSLEVRSEREEQLHQELKDLQRYAKDKQDEFQRKGSELMKKVMKELSGIAEEIGKEEGYAIILERSTSGVVYFSSSHEITDKVIKEYDQRAKK